MSSLVDAFGNSKIAERAKPELAKVIRAIATGNTKMNVGMLLAHASFYEEDQKARPSEYVPSTFLTSCGAIFRIVNIGDDWKIQYLRQTTDKDHFAEISYRDLPEEGQKWILNEVTKMQKRDKIMELIAQKESYKQQIGNLIGAVARIDDQLKKLQNGV